MAASAVPARYTTKRRYSTHWSKNPPADLTSCASSIARRMRDEKSGLLSAPPFLGPYSQRRPAWARSPFATQKNLAPFGTENSIVDPRRSRPARIILRYAGKPGYDARANEYEAGYLANFPGDVEMHSLRRHQKTPIRPQSEERSLISWRRWPGSDPLRLYIAPADDGTAVAFQAIDRIREQFFTSYRFRGTASPGAPHLSDCCYLSSFGLIADLAKQYYFENRRC